MVFQRYARFYDALYRDKDYRGECRYLERIFAKYSRYPVKKVLDLGCGTGGHSLLLARSGYEVTGIDLSPSMLAEAREKARSSGIHLRLRRGDIRTARLQDRFDAVISMFAVMGYQVSGRDARRAVATAARHLRRGGLFVFDVWFGPAVLHDPPASRKKTVPTDDGRIVRTTTCSLDQLAQVVTVRFRTVRYSGRRVAERVEEKHPMRFFFPREIELLLDSAGFSLRLLAPFMALRGRPDEGTWNVAVVAEKTRPLTP